MDIEKKIEEYFQGLWPGSETPEQCNTNMSFTPPAIMRLAEHFYNLGNEDAKKDIHWIPDRTMKLIQKSWYLEGWHDHKFDQPAQFEIGPDLDQKYHPSHMSTEEVQALIDRAYDNGKKDKKEELMKLAIPYKLIGVNSIAQLDMDELAKRDIHWGDNIKVIILKDE